MARFAPDKYNPNSFTAASPSALPCRLITVSKAKAVCLSVFNSVFVLFITQKPRLLLGRVGVGGEGRSVNRQYLAVISKIVIYVASAKGIEPSFPITPNFVFSGNFKVFFVDHLLYLR